MLRLHNIKLPLNFGAKAPAQAAAKSLGISQSAIAHCEISKKSVDARKKSDVCFVVALDVKLKNTQDECRIAARLHRLSAGWLRPMRRLSCLRLPKHLPFAPSSSDSVLPVCSRR